MLVWNLSDSWPECIEQLKYILFFKVPFQRWMLRTRHSLVIQNGMNSVFIWIGFIMFFYQEFYLFVFLPIPLFSHQCKPEYKVPGLYVIDSIVRQSRHQFGQEKDVFAPRFSNNIISTFQNLYRCPGDDKVQYYFVKGDFTLFFLEFLYYYIILCCHSLLVILSFNI